MNPETTGGGQEDTSLFGEDRVNKAHPRVEAYGTVDELNALLGLARAHANHQDAALDADLASLQNALFVVGADLATRQENANTSRIKRVDAQDVTRLERLIDRYQSQVPPLTQFVHPGGTVVSATLHVARTVARRAERDVVRLSHTEPVNDQVRLYLNLLSDLLFSMAHAVNVRAGIQEELWHVQDGRE
jgi:cob(I)alamin adenosyltransferase